MYWRVNALIASLVFLLLLSLPGLAQTGCIRGQVFTTGGQLCGEDEVRAQRSGTNTPSEYDYGRIYWDGIYQIPEAGQNHDQRPGNLLPGIYAVGMSDEYEWRPRNWSYVQVKNGVITPCNIKIIGTYEVRNQDGLTGVYTDIGQTFVAKGGSLQRLTLWLVPSAVTITVRQGGPSGPIVGSPKTIPANSPTVTWMYGEIPTVAGQTYYINFHSDSGFQTYRKSGNPYPSGQAYYNGVAQGNIDLMMTMFEDCDGQATMYHVHLAGNSTRNFYANCGQTFKARGSNILSVSLRFRTGGGPKVATCTIHQGGPGGPQIGPAKSTIVYDYNPIGQKVTFCWLPGEVPVVNGNTYYLRVVADGGLYTFCTENDIYPDGQAYAWDSPWGGDLIGTIMGEVTPGSSTCTISGYVKDANGTPVQSAVISANNGGYTAGTDANGYYTMTVTGDIYDLTCTKTGYLTQTVTGFDAACGTTKTLNWTLPMPGSIAGYVRDTAGNGLVGATVTVTPGNLSTQTNSTGYYQFTGLTPQTYSVTASRYGYISQTKPATVTQGSTTICDFNLSVQTTLQNPSFETTDANNNPIGWTNYGRGLWVKTGQGYGGITPHHGSRYVHNAASWTDPKSGGVYQGVGVPVGVPVFFTAWVACYGEGGGAAHTFDRIGIDPTGGNNPYAGTVQWTNWYNSPADGMWQWVQLCKMVVPTASPITVFLDYLQEPNGSNAWPWQVNAFDDTALFTTPLISVADAKQASDGTFVYFGPAVITAKFSGNPAMFYVEDPTRTVGIRINGTTSYAVGDKVNVYGTIGTSTGERYISLSGIQLVQAGAGDLKPIYMLNRELGGASNGQVPGVTGGIGTNNIGLLVKSAGRVSQIDSTSFYLNDGSGVTVKVVIAPGTNIIPPNGSYAIVTGISSTYDAGGGSIGRLLRAREGGLVWY
jgi:hypothetical protein